MRAPHADPLARRLELHLAGEDPELHVQHALEVHEPGGREVERLVVDEQPDDRAVRRVDDRLARTGEAVGVLRVHDRPRLMEPVERDAGVVRRRAFLGGAAEAEAAVGDGEHRLRRGQVPGIEAALDDLPVRDGIGGAPHVRGEALAQVVCLGVTRAHAASSPRSPTTTCAPAARRASGVARSATPDALRAAGAHVVVGDLGELAA